MHFNSPTLGFSKVSSDQSSKILSQKDYLVEFLFQLQIQMYRGEQHGKFQRVKSCQKLYLESFASTLKAIETGNMKDGQDFLKVSQLEVCKQIMQPLWEARFFSFVYGNRVRRCPYDTIGQITAFLKKTPQYYAQLEAKSVNPKFSSLLFSSKRVQTEKEKWDFINKNTSLNVRTPCFFFSGKKKIYLYKMLMVKNLFKLSINDTDIYGFFENYLLHQIDSRVKQFEYLFQHFCALQAPPTFSVNFIRSENSYLIFNSTLKNVETFINEFLKKENGGKHHLRLKKIGHTLFSYSNTHPGLNFLDFEIRHFPLPYQRGASSNPRFKTTILPSRWSLSSHLKELKKIQQDYASQSQEKFIFALTTKIRSWCNYYRMNSNKKLFVYLDYLLFKMLWRWSCRRHSKKSRAWIKTKYFHSLNGKNWIFALYKPEKKVFITIPFHSETTLINYIPMDNESSPFEL